MKLLQALQTNLNIVVISVITFIKAILELQQFSEIEGKTTPNKTLNFLILLAVNFDLQTIFLLTEIKESKRNELILYFSGTYIILIIRYIYGPLKLKGKILTVNGFNSEFILIDYSNLSEHKD